MDMRDLQKAGMRGSDGALILLIALLMSMLAAVILSGCQTVGGICRDLESVGRYGRQHIKCDE